MKIIFLGCTKFSKEILLYLLEKYINISAIFTIPEEFDISYSDKKVKNYNYVDFSEISNKYEIPLYYINSSENKISNYKKVIEDIQPDVILVMGWYYMVPKTIRDIAKYGTWGIHASLLPKYAGGAPLVWAIINGEEKTGVTLFKLEDGVDDGDIIAQSEINIGFDDSIKEVYDKATIASIEILYNSLLNINTIDFIKQDKTKIEVFSQRSPNDGEIDFNKTGLEIYNFIRAQSPPYPGAFFKTKDGKKIIIDKVRIEDV